MPSHDPAQRPADDAAAVRAHEVRLGHLRGWRYIPLNGKIPIQSDWTNAAPATLDQQLRFADLGNIGLRTGTVTGVVVIDDDTQDQHAADKVEDDPAIDLHLVVGAALDRGRRRGVVVIVAVTRVVVVVVVPGVVVGVGSAGHVVLAPSGGRVPAIDPVEFGIGPVLARRASCGRPGS